MDAKFELGIVKKHLANLEMALEEAEYDKTKLQTELTLTKRETSEEISKLQLQVNILKHQLMLANAETNQYKADAIKWAKEHDDVEYKFRMALNFLNLEKEV